MYLEHGNLLWLDLKPYLNKYVLIKVINYGEYYNFSKNPLFIHVYDFFTKFPNEDIPIPEQRKLYCNPINIIINLKLTKKHVRWEYICNEKVSEIDIPKQALLSRPYNYKIGDPVGLYYPQYGFGSLEFDVPFEEVNHLEFYDNYHIFDLNERVVIEIVKNLTYDVNIDLLSAKEDINTIYEELKDTPTYLNTPKEKRCPLS